MLGGSHGFKMARSMRSHVIGQCGASSVLGFACIDVSNASTDDEPKDARTEDSFEYHESKARCNISHTW